MTIPYIVCILIGMKIGIHFSYWADNWIEDYHRYIDKAADLGFDLLELSCSGIEALYMNEKELPALSLHARQRGLGLTAGFGPGPELNLCSTDKEIVEKCISFYKKICPVLHELGISVLAGPLYSCGTAAASLQGIDKAADWKRTQENFLRVAEIAEQNQITLALEVVNRYEGYLLNTCGEAVRFVDEIGHPSIQILLDTFHMNIEEDDPLQAILSAGHRLAHFHMSEQNRRVPGQGRLPWRDIGRALRQADYQGAAVIEAFVRSSGAPGRKACVWRDLIPEPAEQRLDEDAAASLAFLRKAFSETE